MLPFHFANRSINCRRFPLNNVLSYFAESRRNKARGDMYMPPEVYRTGGTSKGSKHYLPKFRKLRGKKVVKLNLPDFEKYHNNENDEEMFRDRLKDMGLPPLRNTSLREIPYFIPSSMEIFDRFLPRDGIISSLTDKITSPKESFQKMYHNRTDKSIKAIQNADAMFNKGTFGEQALQVYIEAHNALQARDEDLMHEYVTEHAFPLMWDELKFKTLRWEFIRSLEAPKVVHIRANYRSEDTMYGQVTVRLHSQQKLAVFDQFGRLFMGSEDVARDVLEYVIFERFLLDRYGKWRLHAKIAMPESTPPSVSLRTYNLNISTKKEDKSYKYTQLAEYDDEKDDKKS